ncbi:MAG: transposase [Verrucomicrobiaceae bacterium]|nr:transposase [Verrucomicrobiaceae bacterium]
MSKPKHTHATHATQPPHQRSRPDTQAHTAQYHQHRRQETGVDAKARTFSALSLLGTMIFAQLVHALSRNDICDWLRLKTRAIAAFGLTPPSRNNLSYANKERDALFTELVFWRTLEHLHHCDASFGSQRPGGGSRAPLHRFKVRIHAVDSTVMELVANCMGWARHRRSKAAAKMHLSLSLSLNSFLLTFAIVGSAGEHDNKRARELCAGLLEGEVVVFDKAYVDFAHLHDLDLRGVQWVTRAKDNFLLPRPAQPASDQWLRHCEGSDRQAHRDKVEAVLRIERAAGRGLGGGRG